METYMSSINLQPKDVPEMLAHWVGTPENGYLGSNYGYRGRLRSLLAEPPSAAACEEVQQKLRSDVSYFAEKQATVTWEAGSQVLQVSFENTSHRVTVPGEA